MGSGQHHRSGNHRKFIVLTVKSVQLLIAGTVLGGPDADYVILGVSVVGSAGVQGGRRRFHSDFANYIIILLLYGERIVELENQLLVLFAGV